MTERWESTGGINLADEYINQKERFGHWKDCSVMIRGEAVWNLTLMFLQFWNYDEKEKDDVFSYKPDFKVLRIFTMTAMCSRTAIPRQMRKMSENIHISI